MQLPYKLYQIYLVYQNTLDLIHLDQCLMTKLYFNLPNYSFFFFYNI